MTGPVLRSQTWLAGDDEVALEHRVALASAGLRVSKSGRQPVIGIANSASDLNPCNLPLRDLAVEVRAGIEEAGGIGAEFGTISLGEDLMKPSAMLYRNLLAIEIEEMVRANPLDGLVVLANCDKSVPGALMGAISANVPVVLVTGGARPVAQFRGQPAAPGLRCGACGTSAGPGGSTTLRGMSSSAASAAAAVPATRWAPRRPWQSCARCLA